MTNVGVHAEQTGTPGNTDIAFAIEFDGDNANEACYSKTGAAMANNAAINYATIWNNDGG